MYPDPEVADTIERAKDILSKKLGISPREIILESVTEATWPDTSMGMPEKGKSYAMMLVEGHCIVLSAGGHRFEFHSGNGILRY